MRCEVRRTHVDGAFGFQLLFSVPDVGFVRSHIREEAERLR